MKWKKVLEWWLRKDIVEVYVNYYVEIEFNDDGSVYFILVLFLIRYVDVKKWFVMVILIYLIRNNIVYYNL